MAKKKKELSVAELRGLSRVNLKQASRCLGVGYTFACALKKQAGVKGSRFELGAIEAFWRQNPAFKIADAYPRRAKELANGACAVA